MSLAVSSVALAGSRSLAGPAAAAQVAGVVSRLAGAGVSAWSVGCSRGADALCLSALLALDQASRVSVFAVGSQAGAGFWAGSAIAAVRAAASAGASVRWLAGGPLAVPLRARLVRRSIICASSAAALVVWFASPASRGSFLAACSATGAGLPVFAFAVGFPAALLPLLSPAGCWVPASTRGPLAGAFVWAPAAVQVGLFG